MKKVFLLFCALVCVLVTFAACADNPPEETTSVTTSSASDDTNTQPVKTNVVKLKYADVAVRVSRSDINDEKKAIATFLNNTLQGVITITGVSEGSYDLRLYNEFNHMTILNVEVDAEKNVTVNIRSKAEQMEVSQFRYTSTGNKRSDTTMIQAAIDAAHKKFNETGTRQTVYVCPGEYKVDYLQMKEGVTLNLYTKMKKATLGYTAEIETAVKNKEYAIFSLSGRILNCPKTTFALDCTTRNNFSIVGGVLDMRGSGTCALILGRANNVTLENIIFKDVRNGHAIQVTGSTNVTIKNCMFAGFRINESSPSFTAEMLQIEPSAPNSIGDAATADVRFKESHRFSCENIVVDGCYFGKSDEYGAPLMGLGHHSRPNTNTYNVKGLTVQNSVFDQCLYAGIRYNSTDGLKILNNKFIASEVKWADTKAQLDAWEAEAQKTDSTFEISYPKDPTPSLIQFYNYATNDYGVQNTTIEGNTFEIGKGSDHRAIYYKSNTNKTETVTIKNNTVIFGGQPAYSDAYITFTGTTLTYTKGTVTLGGASFSSGTDGVVT